MEAMPQAVEVKGFSKGVTKHITSAVRTNITTSTCASVQMELFQEWYFQNNLNPVYMVNVTLLI